MCANIIKEHTCVKALWSLRGEAGDSIEETLNGHCLCLSPTINFQSFILALKLHFSAELSFKLPNLFKTNA